MAARLDLPARYRIGFDDPVRLALQQHAQHLADIRIVLDDQHLMHGLGHCGGSVAGSVSSNLAPPAARRWASISPPCAVTIALQMARPNPTPTAVPSSMPR